jgi:hypothetical protein
MITTLSAMQTSRIKSWIICSLLVLLLPALGGCSAIRLGYANGPQLAWWWLDGYVDFSREQAPAARAAIDRWFEWHRGTQLPEYAALLAAAQAQLPEAATPALACRWNERLREVLAPALGRAAADFAGLVPGLAEAQFAHLEQRFGKTIDEMREDFLQADPAARLKASIERTVERTERLYGSLGPAQIKVIAAGVEASPFDPELWLVERQRRQRDTVQTLRRLVADKADRDTRVAALRALVARTEVSPDPTYRAYQLRLTDYNCAFAAQIHNATTPAQRQKARDTLKGWEDDLRALALAVPG